MILVTLVAFGFAGAGALRLRAAEGDSDSGPNIRIRTLGGEVLVGRLRELAPDQLVIVPKEGTPRPMATRVADILAIEFPRAPDESQVAPAVEREIDRESFLNPRAAAQVLLTDRSRVACQSFTTDGKRAHLVLASGETANEKVGGAAADAGADTIELPLESVAGVLFSADVEEWNRWEREELKPRAQDMLRVVKDGKQHDLDGAIGVVNAEGLTFSVDGEEVPVRRERVRAISFRHGKVAPDGDAAEVMDRAGNAWVAPDIRLIDGLLQLVATGGIKRAVPFDQVLRVSYSRGRIAYLSDLEPTLVEHTPFFDVAWEFRRDQNFAGTLPRLGGNPFPKSLVVHSRTVLEYDLGGDYRRLAATIGIEDRSGPLGDALVRIMGDSEVLWEERARAGHPGKPIQVSLSGVRKLTLVVDYGGGLDLGDHVLFGDIHVVK